MPYPPFTFRNPPFFRDGNGFEFIAFPFGQVLGARLNRGLKGHDITAQAIKVVTSV